MKIAISLGYVMALLLVYKLNVYTVVAAVAYGACLWVTAYRENDWVLRQHSQHILRITAIFFLVVGILNLGITEAESVLPMPLVDFSSVMNSDNNEVLWEQYPDDANFYVCTYYFLGALLIFGLCVIFVATVGTVRQLRTIKEKGLRKSIDFHYPCFESKKKNYFEDKNQ